MKSSMLESRLYLECDCYSPDHLLVVDALEADEQPEGGKEIYVAEFGFVGNYHQPWYSRLMQAIRYVLKIQTYLWQSDSVAISERNIEQLEELVALLKMQREKLYEK